MTRLEQFGAHAPLCRISQQANGGMAPVSWDGSIEQRENCNCGLREAVVAEMQTLTFEKLRAANVTRCEQTFAEIGVWQPWEWSNAMAGEVGEFCAEGFALLTALSMRAGAVSNLTKKMLRIWPANQYKQSWNKPEDQRMAELYERAEIEAGDVVIYSDLFHARMGRHLQNGVREAFNRKSDEIGSNIKV